MSAAFYLFVPKGKDSFDNLDSVALNWVYKTSDDEFKLGQGMLDEASRLAVQHNVTVVLPGEDILFLAADVPGKNLQRIQQAIPFVLEDSVIDDVDTLHFAIGKSSEERAGIPSNHFQIAVINKHHLESVIEQLGNAGIQAEAITADYLLLSEGRALSLDGDRILYNSTDQKFALNIESILSLDGYLPANESIKLIQCKGNASENVNVLIEKYNFENENCDFHPLMCLVKNSSGNSINLLQGKYKKKKNWSQAGKTWLPVAALFLIWLSVQSVLFVVDYAGMSRQNQRLNDQIIQIYKKTFPESQRIVDAKVQMQQQLTSLKKRKGISGRGFTEMLASSAKIFSSTKSLGVKSLRYYDGRINLELTLPSLQSLEQMKKQLSKDSNYKVEIQNVSSGKEQVTAQLQIIGAAL